MKSTIITLIMLMCGFTVVRAQKVIITEEEINDAIFEVTGINFNSSSSSNSNSNSKGGVKRIIRFMLLLKKNSGVSWRNECSN